MRRVMIWCLLTEKRLLKKISYVAVLLIVPILVFGLRQASSQEAGIVTIGLYTPDEDGSLSDTVLKRFTEEKSILRFLRYETEEEAIKALTEKTVDAVWILPEGLEDKLAKMAEKRTVKPVARVLEREDDVALIFTREVLCSRIFPELAYQVYLEFIDRKLDGNGPEKEELLARFERNLWKGNLFQAEYLDGKEEAADNYFMAPIRGLLAIWLVLSGFAGILYQKQDEMNGLFDAIPGRKRIWYAFGMQAVVLFNGGVIYLMACKIMGVLERFWQELFLLLLLLFMIACFCNVIGLLIKRMEGIGILIPVMTLLMIAFCPIFINLRKYGALQSLLPPYLYLKTLNGVGYLKYMVIYVATGLFACALINKIKYRR